jgi:catechol 2,3-dioxygenase-like lactoylglutathione lyase family enzyme
MQSLDHITLVVSDYARSKAFYEKALAPLGIALVMEFGQACGFGRKGKPDFWIGTGPASFQRQEHLRLITPTHVAFAAHDRAQVDAFHAAALAAGGRDFGAPGLRTHYHPNYYGAFVLDPDGHDIEAVFHGAASASP